MNDTPSCPHQHETIMWHILIPSLYTYPPVGLYMKNATLSFHLEALKLCMQKAVGVLEMLWQSFSVILACATDAEALLIFSLMV